MVIWFSTGTLGIFATFVYVFTIRVVIYDILSMAIISTLTTSILFCNLCYIYYYHHAVWWKSPWGYSKIWNINTHKNIQYTVWWFLPYCMVITTLHNGSLSIYILYICIYNNIYILMYREICHKDFSEFHLTLWEKSPKVSKKYILLCFMAIIAIFS